MPLRKLFSFDSDEVRHPRPQARYLEGRGAYPEGRDMYEESVMYEELQQDEFFHQGEPDHLEEIGFGRPADRVNRRRLPLTTLDALLQIKANRLAHSA